ncbi:hypothetical protein MVES1_002928 [Malassezia vespertilionis]|uniref:Mediator of RNA polymerase II transcription subunit 7 n=1 Tax=Malassezia vespertilionis TaxID=2020962 RepID=A0A2N1J909_9BASI|nr:uncharacterized protein MVES1_002928 [Malassezia vespertilionis]PKI83014.1 Med7p [Malassezia vespertilionis]WFD07561.1 hypothetical protein MVES1_002928 [Malassezia vespertilionis]
MPDEDGAAESVGTTSVFPPPPIVWHAFTEANVLWSRIFDAELEKAGEKDAWFAMPHEARKSKQDALLSAVVREHGDIALPTVDLHELTPPNVQWIEEDGGYQLFGQRWPIPDVAPSLEQLGIPRMFPQPLQDRNEALQKLLRTLLHTYFMLTSDLLRPIQPYDVWVPQATTEASGAPSTAATTDETPLANATASEANGNGAFGVWTTSTRIKDRLKHMEMSVINFQFILNQLRPIQNSATLEHVLDEQIERRRRQTRLLRAKSASIREAMHHISL